MSVSLSLCVLVLLYYKLGIFLVNSARFELEEAPGLESAAQESTGGSRSRSRSVRKWRRSAPTTDPARQIRPRARSRGCRDAADFYWLWLMRQGRGCLTIDGKSISCCRGKKTPNVNVWEKQTRVFPFLQLNISQWHVSSCLDALRLEEIDHFTTLSCVSRF